MLTGLRNRTTQLAALLALFLAPAACDSPAAPPGSVLLVTDLPADQLPAPDPARTWKYRFSTVDADSVTRALLRAGLPLLEAWEPLEDLCADPIGPRFTVVLAAPDARMERYDFEKGSGIRACTRLVRRYVPRE